MTDTPGLAAALAELQTKLPKIGKAKTANTGTYSYAFADLAAVSAQIMPLLGQLGMSFTARPTYNEAGAFVLAYRLWHTSGEMLEGEYPLPTGTPQTVGSAITYGRRYSLCAITGVAPEDDDDGAAAQSHAHQQQTAQPKPAARKRSAYDRGSPADKPAGGTLTISKRQLAALHIRLGEYGIGGKDNRDAALAYMSDVTGRTVESSTTLTETEFRTVMDRLADELAKGTDVPPDDPTLDPDYQP